MHCESNEFISHKNKAAFAVKYGGQDYEHRSLQTCLMVIAGLQSLSSSRMDRHTVPDG